MQYGESVLLNFGLVLLGAAVLSVPIARGSVSPPSSPI